MFNLKYSEIISRIKEEKSLSDEEIDAKIKEKLKQLSDLISKEGAAHIVANELGVKILSVPKEIKVNRLLTGMNNVVISGKVVKMNDIVNFNRNGRAGKVGSFIFGDDTGVVRVAFWDVNHIKEIENGNIKEGSVLKIKNAYVKANGGYKELHLGSKGDLEINPDGVDIEVSNQPVFGFERKKISELQEGDNNIGVFGTIVQVFEPRFYDACPNCGKKLETIGDSSQCKEHGLVNPVVVPILNLFLDDGSDNLRAVAFRNQVERLLNVDNSKLLEIKEDANKFNGYRDDLIGKQLMLVGRITKNEMFDRKEMTIQSVIEVNPGEMIKELQDGV